MTEKEQHSTNTLNAAGHLRELMLENPELPLLVMAGEDANVGDYGFMVCSKVTAEIGECLDCEQIINNERIYTDRDDFEEDLRDFLSFEFQGSDEDFEAKVAEELAQYEPYWKDCIIVHADN